ncbi:MAG: hypothetical protein KDE53_28555 [Caldilineaceae bacterium]|nr:hypothetical protein [Caldilineaceae bacterium]
MNKTHFYLYGNWVDAIDSEDETIVAQYRAGVAERYGVDVSLIVVMKLEDVQYRG